MTFASSQQSLFESAESTPNLFRWLRAGSPVKTSPRREKVKASKALGARSGGRCVALSAQSVRLGLSLRTSLLSALEARTRLSLAWSVRDTLSRRRAWWVLGRSGRPTEEAGYGLWPTPAAAQGQQGENEPDGKRGQTLIGAARGQDWMTPTVSEAEHGHGYQNANGKDYPTLTGQVGAAPMRGGTEWATPNASVANDGETLESWLARRERTKQTAANGNGFGMQLTQQVRMDWPTPTVQDGENNAGASQFDRNTQPLNVRVLTAGPPAPESDSTNGKRRGFLNPAWVAQLMGYPDGWLDIEPQNLKLWETR
jgi:hypothetical protein